MNPRSLRGMSPRLRFVCGFVPSWLLTASLGLLGPRPLSAADLQPALRSITTNDLARHTLVLASDAFEGRAPGGAGEEKSVQYLAEQYKSFGLEPAGPGGSWFQEVPLVGIKSEVALHLARDGKEEAWQFPQDYVGWTRHAVPQVHVAASELIFVGYGVVAPEYQWDDYKDVDVRGKTLVMLVNDPPIPDAQDATKLDDAQFRGKAMTYYGRWTYKFEIAAAKGAAAALLIHETGPAGYPYFVVINSWGRENFDLSTPDRNTNTLGVAAWISQDRGQRLLAESGTSLEAMKKAALSRAFRPRPLGASIRLDVTNQLREVRSRNVLAKLPGAHPQLKNEQVVFTSHWDHLGKDDRLEGDKIFNGALDNASGSAALLELAEAFAKLSPRPDRTLIFASVTAEEQGLLGAKYYAQNPPYPLTTTLANLNIDGVNVVGRCPDVGVVGYGLNTLEDVLAKAARTQGRTVRAEEEPEKGGFYRSDHFEFAKVGVPALYLDSSSDHILGQAADYGRMRRDEYREKDYHKVSDEMKPWWNFEGAVEDCQLLFLVGYEVATTREWPVWKPGAEFKERREKMLRSGR